MRVEETASPTYRTVRYVVGHGRSRSGTTQKTVGTQHCGRRMSKCQFVYDKAVYELYRLGQKERNIVEGETPVRI
jgi:hypothetical protein